jgi:hypothetical protein
VSANEWVVVDDWLSRARVCYKGRLSFEVSRVSGDGQAPVGGCRTPCLRREVYGILIRPHYVQI